MSWIDLETGKPVETPLQEIVRQVGVRAANLVDKLLRERNQLLQERENLLAVAVAAKSFVDEFIGMESNPNEDVPLGIALRETLARLESKGEKT